jgi:hypothetical protein
MPADDTMTLDERLKYLRRMQKRYLLADRQTRSALLDEMVHVTDLDRKTLIRRMRSDLARRPRRKQRGRTYDHQVDDALRLIARTWDFISAERLAPNLGWMAASLAAHGELTLTPELQAQLAAISTSTVARILQRLRQDEPRLPRSGPREANRLRREVPMGRIPWDETRPGHFEADLVFHSGPARGGEHMHTLQLIDVATAWSERVAVLGRSFVVMRDAFEHIVRRLPFPIREIHPDNGSEFFNHHLVQFWGERIQGVTLSRSRPWHKNDNRFVEQKNDTLVRAYFGQARLDTVAQTRATNALYEDMWAYYNLFQPVMRLVAKEVTEDAQGTRRVRRRYDPARTPFDRLCATGLLPQAQQEALARRRDGINPRLLREHIHEQRDALFRLPGAAPGQSEDVYATLLHPECI